MSQVWPKMTLVRVFIAIFLVLVPHVGASCGGTCPEGWWYDFPTNKCYRVLNTPKSWIDARADCLAEGGNLLEMTSEDDMPGIIKNPDIIPTNQNYWIGLNDRNQDDAFRWNNANENATYFKWSRNHPYRNSDIHNCVSMKKNGANTIEWYNMLCNSRQKFFCQRLSNEDMEVHMARIANYLDVTCPEGYTRVAGRRKCFKIILETVVYEAAMNKCRDDIPGKTTLLDMPDFEVNDLIREAVGTRNLYWIAPTDEVEEGVWKATTLPGAKPVTYLPWQPRSRHSSTNTNCVALTPGRNGAENTYFNVGCTQRRNFICQYDPPAPGPTAKVCPTGWERYAQSEMCFKVMGQRRVKWNKAQDSCEAMDGQLATIPDQGTHDFVKDIVSGERYWIGLVDKEKNGTFSWLGQDTEMDFKAWKSPPKSVEGQDFCAELIGSKEGKWNDKSCETKRLFICEKDATVPTFGDEETD